MTTRQKSTWRRRLDNGRKTAAFLFRAHPQFSFKERWRMIYLFIATTSG